MTKQEPTKLTRDERIVLIRFKKILAEDGIKIGDIRDMPDEQKRVMFSMVFNRDLSTKEDEEAIEKLLRELDKENKGKRMKA